MFSNQESSWPQLGHAEGGLTTDVPVGSLWMTTLAKLPIVAPNMAASVGKYQAGSSDNSATWSLRAA